MARKTCASRSDVFGALLYLEKPNLVGTWAVSRRCSALGMIPLLEQSQLLLLMMIDRRR
jgi:hypothetical protein